MHMKPELISIFGSCLATLWTLNMVFTDISKYAAYKMDIYVVPTKQLQLLNETQSNSRSAQLLKTGSHEHQAWKYLKCQERRLKDLKTQCLQLGPQKDIETFSEEKLRELFDKFIVDDRNRVIVKSVPKTGCNSWKALLLMNSPHYNNTMDDVHLHNWTWMRQRFGLTNMKEFNKSDILHRMNSYYSVLTVRHPLARLESAFVDKLVINGIYNDLRETNMDKFDNELIFPYFEDFLMEIINATRSGESLNTANIHWRPIVYHAHPCLVPFRHLAKTETADIEMDYISQVKMAGVGGAVHQNQHRVTSTNPRSDGGDVLPLFSGLKNPAEIIKALPDAYKLGMKLFGYNVKIEKDKAIAVCDSFEEYGMCC